MSGLLSDHDIHVWTVPLSVPPAELARLTGLLSAEERQRADRYLYHPGREQFTVTRGRLRLLLGRYLGTDPAGVTFASTNTGKPTVPGVTLTFNVSHTHGLALIAIAGGIEVGVDVEQVRAQPNHLELASRYFTPGEARRLHGLPIDLGVRAFFHVWTRKEAFMKATGLGLSYGLERFEVSVPPDEPCRLLHIHGDAAAAARWTLLNLEPGPDYVAALAFEGQGYRVEVKGYEASRVA